ncbi:unnamed protein product [Nezara viridula]|uniref:Uncharacterized protein n=1 Tax=Nezara viridula TaxID=85310 RepID=A0A9P0HH32_NEZVI|nr:unnamed protein product [Nezara viridula]
MTMDSFSVWTEYRRVRFGSFQSSRKSEGRSLLARDEMDFRRWLARSSRGKIVLLARKSFLSSSDFFVLESSRVTSAEYHPLWSRDTYLTT